MQLSLYFIDIIAIKFVVLRCMDREKPTYYRLCCPNCGKFTRVRILSLEGKAKISMKCRDCGQVSIIELQDIKASE